MFISGYYGIKYRPARLFSLWLQCAFYFLCLTIIADLLSDTTHYFLLGKFWAPLTNGGWWFVTCYAMVYILSPIINQGITHISRIEFKWILILTGLMLYVGKFINFTLSTEFILLLFIYLIGRYFNMYGWQSVEKYAGTILIIGLTLLIAIPYALGSFGITKLLKLFFSNYNPLIAITAISMFFVATRLKMPRMHPFLLSLCSNTLAAYIITDYPLIREWLINKFITPYGHSIPHAVICISIGLVICLVIEECRKRMMRPLEKRAEARLTHQSE